MESHGENLSKTHHPESQLPTKAQSPNASIANDLIYLFIHVNPYNVTQLCIIVINLHSGHFIRRNS